MRYVRLRRLRDLAAVLTGGALLFCGGAAAQDDASLRERYELAIRCFVTYGTLRGDSGDAGDQASAGAFEQRAHRAFQVAGGLGNMLDYSRDQMERDIGAIETREMPRMVKDKAYLKSAEAACRAHSF